MTPKEQLAKVCRSWELCDHQRGRLLKATSSCVLALFGESGRQPVVGGSRFGGGPDLPPDAPWPFVGDRPLQFMLQIDLKDLPDESWPTLGSGLLQVYYDDINGEAGPDSQLVVVSDSEHLVFREPPPDPQYEPGSYARHFPLIPLDLECGLSLPWALPSDLLDIEEALLGDYVSFRYDCLEAFSDGRKHHQLFGHPGGELPSWTKTLSFLLQVNHVHDKIFVFQELSEPKQLRPTSVKTYYSTT